MSCVLGLLWSLFNVFLVNKIDVEKGVDGESDSLVGDIPAEQKQLLIELGEKISNVLFHTHVGRYLVFETVISNLPNLRRCHVCGHLAAYC